MSDVTDQVIVKVGPSDRLPSWWPRLLGTGSSPIPAPLSRQVLLKLGGLFLVWRSTILLFSFLWGRMGLRPHLPPWWADMWLFRYSVGWDSGWYLTITERGYHGIDDPAAIGFFPMFPLLIRGAHWLLPGQSDVFAALVVVHLALIAAILYVYQLVRLSYPEAVAWRTLVFLLVFPSAFFFSAVYTESLLLLAFAGTLYHARRGQWILAGLFVALASATKLVGIVAMGPLVLEILAQDAWRRPLRVLAGLGLAPLGLIGYFSYLQVSSGSFLDFFQVKASGGNQQPFHPVFLMGIQWLLGDRSASDFYDVSIASLKTDFVLLDTTTLWLFVAAGLLCWWRIRPSYGALVLGGILMPGLSGTPASMNRYAVILFPAFMLLGMVKSEVLRTAVMITSTFGLAFVTWLFINGYWAG